MMELLRHAQDLVDDARASAGERTLQLTGAQWKKLILLRALVDFECQLEDEVGEFQMKDGTIAFKPKDPRAAAYKFSDAQRARIRQQGERFKTTVVARHWLFHHTGAEVDLGGVLLDMGHALHALTGIKAGTLSDVGALYL